MALIVVPFRGADANSRLGMPSEARRRLGLAMLGDVLEVCAESAETRLVSSDDEARAVAAALGCDVAPDPGGGQGAAVAAALAVVPSAPVAVVNADLPCATPADVEAVLDAAQDAVALVAARDGTTNALGLPAADVFAPLYGAGSAARFRAHAVALGLASVTVAAPNLIDDVDTVVDLRRVQERAGRRTRAAIDELVPSVAL
jgi:2-phospho-L-lactate guanylyltransferase